MGSSLKIGDLKPIYDFFKREHDDGLFQINNPTMIDIVDHRGIPMFNGSYHNFPHCLPKK